jgi:hypothetical protein
MFFRWTFPGAPIRIDLPLALIERLKREALRSGAAEVGGMLFGEIDPDCVRLTGFEPFPHQDGPLYSLDSSERGAFAEALLRKPDAVGYYRSHLRDGLSLDAADLALMCQCFPAPGNVVLLIRPEPHGEVTAGFFFWDEGRIHSEFSFLEFPLDAAELRDSAPRPQRPRRMPWSLAAAPLLLALAVWLTWTTPPAPRPELQLRAEREGPQITLRWQAPVPADGGRISVRDAGGERAFPLTPEQVRAGIFRYVPKGRELRFRLEVAGAASENVFVLASPRDTLVAR